MKASKPLEHEDQIYPLYTVNLSIVSTYENGKPIAKVAGRLIPSRVDEFGNLHKVDSKASSLVLLINEESNQSDKIAMEKIASAVQEYITSKGL